MSNDIKARTSQKELRITESVEEFSISQLVRAGMKDYTKNLRDFLESNHDRYNRLKPDSTFVSYLELLVSLEASDMIGHYNMQNR